MRKARRPGRHWLVRMANSRAPPAGPVSRARKDRAHRTHPARRLRWLVRAAGLANPPRAHLQVDALANLAQPDLENHRLEHRRERDRKPRHVRVAGRRQTMGLAARRH